MKTRFFLVFAAFAIIASFTFFLLNAGTWLVKTDTLVKGDAIVMLMGSMNDRVAQAADVYKNNLAKYLLIVEPEIRPDRSGNLRSEERRVGKECR